MLDAEGPPDRIVMHCFSGDADFARACLDRGAYLSFAGTVTFKPTGHCGTRWPSPLDRVLIETDAPYLTPMPFRGRPNASYLIPHTARFMADHPRDRTWRALCRALTDNADGRLRRELVAMELREVLRRRRMVRGVRPGSAGAAARRWTRSAPPRSARPSAGFTQGVSLLVLSRRRAVRDLLASRGRDAAPRRGSRACGPHRC